MQNLPNQIKSFLLSCIAPTVMTLVACFFSTCYVGIAIWPAFWLTKIFVKKIHIKNFIPLLFINTIFLATTFSITFILNVSSYDMPINVAIGALAAPILAFLVGPIILKYLKNITLNDSERAFLGAWSALIFLIFLLPRNSYFDSLFANPITFTIFLLVLISLSITSIITFNKRMKS